MQILSTLSQCHILSILSQCHILSTVSQCHILSILSQCHILSTKLTMLISKHILTLSHFNYNYTQLTMSQSKHPAVWFPAPSMYQQIIIQRENDRSGEIRLGMGVVYNIIILARLKLYLARVLEFSLALHIPHVTLLLI